MKTNRVSPAIWVRGIIIVLLSLGLPAAGWGASARGERGMVVTGHPLATEAGLDALRRGGNAIDAAVAAGLTLGVVDGHNSGIGGGCVMLIRQSNGRILALDGREMASLSAWRDMYVRDGVVNLNLSQFGPLAIATPGALVTYNLAAANYGRLPIAEPLLRAARLAETGFPIDAAYAQRLAETAGPLSVYPATRALFLRADGSIPAAGEILRQPELARTYRGIAAQGIGYFYTGPFAVQTVQWMAENGGILSALDLASYQVGFRQPLTTTYRGRAVVGFPPPSSGGVAVAEILNILENFDLRAMGVNSPDFVHVVAEAMKLAFADRAHWLGDPDHVRVPQGLAFKPYAAQLARQIRMDRATPVPRHGVPLAPLENFFGRHTTHFSVADAAGNWVSCTATLNTAFGSKVVIPGTGVLMNNQMDDFSLQPGVPNFFGLIGGEANAIAPGKRPLTSMSPTLVMENRRPVLALGAAGGPAIISQIVLAIIHHLDFGMDVATALAQPRFHQQWQPDELRIEPAVGEAVIQELQRRGHRVTQVRAIGAANALGLSPDATTFIGASEPRGYGRAEGW